MQLKEAIIQRRAVKHFDPNYIISDADIQDILDLSFQSPSSFNLQHWRIVNVTDKALRQDIRKISWDQAQVTDASHLFIFCGDLNTSDKYADTCWKDTPKATQDMIIPMIHNFYKDNAELRRDEAIRSVGIFSQTFMLAVKSKGYDSCPMIGFDADALADLINLPKDHVIGMMLPVGKATQAAYPKAGFLPQEKVMVENKW